MNPQRIRGGPADPVEVVALNTLGAEGLGSLDAETRSLIERRIAVMGKGYKLSYNQPFQPVRALGTKIYDVHGHEYLDAYNNVASVGHNHPRVVGAVTRQLETLNTNTRYLQRGVIEYAEDLISTQDPALGNVTFTCTGSEANDLAARIARKVTGGTGIIATEYAYHGNTDDVSSWSPSVGASTPLGREVRLVQPPDFFRMPDRDLSSWFAEQVRNAIDDLQRYGIRLAAFVVDSLFSSDGIYPDPGVLKAAAKIVRDAGGLVISDEVQPGFGRISSHMWGYQRSGFVPDLITMGKPMGNGMPIAGVVAKPAIMDEFTENVSYFNTFGGETALVAAGQAVLDVIREEDLLANGRDKSEKLINGMRSSIRSHSMAVDVRGAGMYLGVEFVDDFENKMPDVAAAGEAVNSLRRRRVLTSTAGPHGNVIKLRPPLVFSQSDVDRFLDEFDGVLREMKGGGHSQGEVASVGPLGELGEDLRRVVAEELRALLKERR